MAIKFRKLIQGLLFVSSMGFAASGGATMVYRSDFSAAGTGGWKNLGIYFYDGKPANPPDPAVPAVPADQATQTFMDTGLYAVNRLELTLNLSPPTSESNKLTPGVTLGFSFFLSPGTKIAPDAEAIRTTSYESTDTYQKGPRVLDFSFAELFNDTDEWTLQMKVTQGVCDGCGHVRFSRASDPSVQPPYPGNPLTLFGATAIPEPTTLALLGLSFAGLGFARRQRA